MARKSPTKSSAVDFEPLEKGEPTTEKTGGKIPDAIHREIRMSPTIGKLAKALVSFQGDIAIVEKDSDGYNYAYLSLGGLLETIRPLQKKYGIAITQHPISQGDGDLGVATFLLHESGEYMQSEFVMPTPKLSGANVTQQAGAALTYARRYAISAILRIAADEDTDAS